MSLVETLQDLEFKKAAEKKPDATSLRLRAFGAVGYRERADMSGDVTGDDRALLALLKRTGLLTLSAAAAANHSRLTVTQVDAALSAAGITGTEAIEAKLRLFNAGILTGHRDPNPKAHEVLGPDITGRWPTPKRSVW
jgi:hypothetical protein